MCFNILLSISYLEAQQSPNYNNIVPASPTVSELAKYTSIPVSHYTGVPDISIPIAQLKCGNITVPISISYHAGGIQVDQIASSVGLGWSLNAGGVITQTQKKSSDLSNFSRQIMTFDDINKGNYLPAKDVHSLTSDSHDTEPDIFSYNFLGYSGRLLIDKDKKFYDIRGSQELKFEKYNQGLKAIDLNGVEYHFMQVETMGTETIPYNLDRYNSQKLNRAGGGSGTVGDITAFYLTAIVSADKKYSVTFSYIDEYQEYEGKVNGTVYYDVIGKKWTEYAGDLLEQQWRDQKHIAYVPSGNFTITRYKCNTKKIASISSNTGESYTFRYSDEERKDLKNTKALKLIDHNRSSKIWQFNYDYFESDPKVIYATTSTLEKYTQNYRLRLASFTEVAPVFGGGSIQKKYKLEYYGDQQGEPLMPFRNALSGQDAWGYCNAKISDNDAFNVKNIFPCLTFFTLTDALMISNFGRVGWNGSEAEMLNLMKYKGGSNRDVNEQFATAYSLKSIIYPTGGKSEFIYESHRYGHVSNRRVSEVLTGGLRIKEIKHHVDDSTFTSQKYEYIEKVSPAYYPSGTIVNDANFITQTMLSLGETGGSNPLKRTADIFLKMNSNSFTPMYTIGGEYIGYSTVTEITEEGKTVLKFYSAVDFPSSYSMCLYSQWGDGYGPEDIRFISGPYPSLYYDGYDPYLFEPSSSGYNGYGYGRGKLLSKKMYDILNNEVFSETYKYDFIHLRDIYGMEVKKAPSTTGPTRLSTNLNIYYHSVGMALLRAKLSKMNTPQGTINHSENYTYNVYGLVSESKVILNETDSVVTITRYPNDINSTTYIGMKNANMLNYPIETVTIRGNKILKSLLTTYDKINNFYLPTTIYNLSQKEKASFAFYDGKTKDSGYSFPEYNVVSYDNFNNIQEVLDKSGISVVFIWNYKQQLLAELRNTTYSDIYKVDPGINSGNLTVSRIDELRPKLTNSHITTYSYSLNYDAISSVTNPQGITTKYNYDPLGRLQSVTDYNDNIISFYRYKYANE